MAFPQGILTKHSGLKTQKKTAPRGGFLKNPAIV